MPKVINPINPVLEKIVKGVKAGKYFDTYYVIKKLTSEYTSEFSDYKKNYLKGNKSIDRVKASLSRRLNKLPNLEYMGKVISLNEKVKYTEVSLFRKLKRK